MKQQKQHHWREEWTGWYEGETFIGVQCVRCGERRVVDG